MGCILVKIVVLLLIYTTEIVVRFYGYQIISTPISTL